MADITVDKVRASRDGHQFHEAWLARRALGLLLPRDELCGIAVEGLTPEDQTGTSTATVEIADATFYFGAAPTFRDSTRVEIAQFKYSIARQGTKFLASDAAKTLQKFAKSESKFLSKPAQQKVANKISYTIYTNRPIGSELTEALSALAKGDLPSKKNSRAQYHQLLSIIPLNGDHLKKFAAKVFLVGQGGDLQTIEKGNARIIADWSASNDAKARARLGDLRQLVRDKAGHKGQQNNVITNIDVLAALDIAEEIDLLPTPDVFVEPGPIVEREQIQTFIDNMEESDLWIIHAAGGVGKTVFAQSVASRLIATDEVVIFDCFGGGAYRSPLDMRHRPERGLMHIVNDLACRGLCDPILPGSSDPAEVARRSIQRFSQAIATIRRTRPKARLVLIIDAVDNAAMEARDKQQVSFPQMLLESLSQPSHSIDGLVCVATARSQRRDLAIGRSQCKDFELRAFSADESQSFIKQRRPEATSAQIEAIHHRSNGNPRVIANLIEPDRPLAEIDTVSTNIDVNDLIRQRLEGAIRLADDKGCDRDEISGFLCALSVLPPPVPVAEIAAAFGITTSEVESFAADLAPLLEHTRHGLIFRDEPTETLIRESYGQQLTLLNDVVSRLSKAQSSSVYAARSLPSLLFAMGETEKLRSLAFDTRFPPELDSDIAKRAIRLNRLRTAVGAAAKDRDFSASVDLLVELASMVIVDERGEDYLLEQPDLVVGLGDPEALRRLFEARSGWPGTRHARLATAYVADGDTAEAYGYAKKADDWHQWQHNQDEKVHRTNKFDHGDYASIAFYLFSKERGNHVAGYIAQWKPFYGYCIACRLFEYCLATESFGNLPNFAKTLNEVLSLPKAPPALVVAALNFFPGFVSRTRTKALLKKLAATLKSNEEFSEEFAGSSHKNSYRKALIRCAIRMANLNMVKEMDRTFAVAVPQRYRMWSLHGDLDVEKLVSFALSVASRCASESRVADLFDCLPKEFWALVKDASRPSTDEAQRALLDERLKELRTPHNETPPEIQERLENSGLSSSELSHAADRISYGVMPLLALVKLLTTMIAAAKPIQAKAATLAFFEAWQASQAGTTRNRVYIPQEQLRFVDALYTGCASEIFMALDLLTPCAAQKLASCLQSASTLAPETIIYFVRLLAGRLNCHKQAGKMAVLAVKHIERDRDIQCRSRLFASLSRALLQANRSESTDLFKRGLQELDAIGSGDYEFAHELLQFAITLRGGHLQPNLALRLAKICEINVYDSDKWHWPLTAKAFARAVGAPYLAQIARWHDRDIVKLSLTLPSALTYMVKEGALRPIHAVSLLWLVSPEPLWSWGWNDLLNALAEQNTTESMLHEVLDQYEHSFPGRSANRYLCELREVLESDPALAATISERITLLEQRNTKSRIVEKDSHSPPPPPRDRKLIRKQEKERQANVAKALAKLDPIDTASFESFAEELKACSGWNFDKSQAFKKVRARVAYADRAKHLETIVAARNLSLSEKNDLLQAIKDEWTEDSPTQLSCLSACGLPLVKEHAEELLGKTWGTVTDISKLSEVTSTPIDQLAIVLVESATTRQLDASAMTWLSIATIISKRAEAEIPLNALERLLDSGAARLVDEIGDGAWRDELNPGTDSDEIAAGLIWFCLGSPKAKERWRAAHAVRSAARFGQWSVIERMFGFFDETDAGAFQDRALPFFKYNAQLWFLIAIARIAMDFPDDIAARFRPKMETIAFQDAFPHVGIRQAACEALRHCAAGKCGADTQKLLSRIAKANVSMFPLAKTREKAVREFPWERPKDIPRPEPTFYFDYDFEKYNIDALARVFGLPKWRIKDLCRDWIRIWAPEVTSMNDFSGKPRPYSRHGYYRPTEESYQSHGAYLAWHALAVVSGRLLSERPVTDESFLDDPWKNWLAEYSITRDDGHWISDGTDGYPLVALNDLRASSSSDTKREQPINDKQFLTSLAGLEDSTPEGIIVQAWWSSPDNVNCGIMSSLVDPAHAKLAALAIITSPHFHMYLPFHEFDDDESPRFRSDGMEPCDPWITHTEQSEALDAQDPFGASSALSIYRPARNIIARFKLVATKPWSHKWMEKGGSTVFRYNGWGGWQGYGDSENRQEGKALYCDRRFLSKLLTQLDKNLIILIKLRVYHEPNRHDKDSSQKSEFIHSFMAAVLDKHLNVQIIEPTTKQLKAVSKLNQYDIYKFSKRFLTIAMLES
ncbi:AAA ATPase [Solidesulfovibrio fructosivorans JJ]]|uniref:AAA ATPase n=1 Tax=Solidesulfovibrio fructosivorans JJ] TaxID=596151 RepID=E1JRE4_SOLFR|nr:hypothetical protein [Solidesulfovibrio fructosivorans]EFL53145.1 AAA ATPase [Solidesulfovibrio fructosivorans JJ]]